MLQDTISTQDEWQAARDRLLAEEKEHTHRGDELASAHFRLGTILEKQGRAAEAREHYAASLRLDPGQPDAKEALKRVR